MPKNTDRDESVDRMLRQTLKAPLPPEETPGSCIDAETLAAWTGGALSPGETARVEAHSAGCERCQALVAAFARTAPVPVEPAPLWQRWHLRWLVPIAAAATTVAIWIAVPAERRTAVVPELDSLPSPASSESRAADTVGGTAAGQASATPRDQDTTSDQALAPEGPAAAPQAARAAAPAAPPPAALQETALMRLEAASPEIASPDSANRWRILAGATVERSTDSGNSWEATIIAAPGALVAGSSPGGAVCWLVGRAGAVSLTVDGVRFEVVPFPETIDLVEVRASSATSAIVTAADGRQFRTDDRGRTWARVAR